MRVIWSDILNAIDHNKKYMELMHYKQQSTSSSDVGEIVPSKRRKTINNVALNATKIRAACVELVTTNGRPFSIINDSVFRKIGDPIMAALPPTDKFALSPAVVRSDVIDEATAIRRNITEEITVSDSSCLLICSCL